MCFLPWAEATGAAAEAEKAVAAVARTVGAVGAAEAEKAAAAVARTVGAVRAARAGAARKAVAETSVALMARQRERPLAGRWAS